MAPVAILGAGPHGHEIRRLLWEAAYRDKTDDEFNLFDDYLPGFPPLGKAYDLQYFIGAAMPAVRRAIDEKRIGGERASYLGSRINGQEWVGPVGVGSVVFPGARISYNAKLGEHVHVLYNAVVSHGCNIGDFVTISALAGLAGDVTVESGAFIGQGAQIRHGGITIGRNAIVGIGAVVLDDVPDNTKVVGVPARPLVAS